MASYKPVNAVLRAMKVLEAIAAEKRTTVNDLYKATGFPKPTLVRLLETFIHAGYVQAEGAPTSYSLTPRALFLASGFNSATHLRTVVGAILAEFQRGVSWPTDLAMFDRDAMVIVETNREPGVLSVNRQVGSRVTAVRTALGRAYLAHVPDPARTGMLETLQRLTKEPEDIAAFDAVLETVRRQGFATSDQENLPNIRSVAVPVFGQDGVIASLNIIVLANVMTMSALKKKYVSLLKSAAEKMSAALCSVPRD